MHVAGEPRGRGAWRSAVAQAAWPLTLARADIDPSTSPHLAAADPSRMPSHTGPAQLRLDFVVTHWVDLDTLVHTTLAGLRDAGWYGRGLPRLRGVLATKQEVGKDQVARSARGQATGGQGTPDQAAEDHASQDPAAPDQATPDQAPPDQATEATPDPATENQSSENQASADQAADVPVPGVTITGAALARSRPPGRAALQVTHDEVPRTRAAVRRWRDVLALAWGERALLDDGNSWIDVALGPSRSSLLGGLEPVLDALEPVLGRDPRGRTELFPNDHLVTWLRVQRSAAGPPLTLTLGRCRR